jgi:hypothetical protein
MFLQTNDTKKKEQIYSICNEEKHNIELFTDLNQNNNGKEGYFKTLQLRNIKAEICKEIHLNQVYKTKSEKMIGYGNHNFGKTFSEETKKKMSNSIRDAKGGILDETIIAVRNMIKDGYKNSEIQHKLELPRHTISKIKNGLLVCRTESKNIRESLTKEQQNINKRKIKIEEIMIVIDMTINNKTPMEILDHLIETRNLNNISNNLTIDIIKNIKRNITNGKNVIYESELSCEKYNHYLDLITKIYKLHNNN